MMKLKTLTLLLLAMLLAACATPGTTPTTDLQATVVSMQVQLTVAAGDLARAEAALAQPTATCATCPTCTPVPSATPLPQTPTPVPSPTPTETPRGSISGSLAYPSEFIPAQRVIAFNIATGEYYWVNTVDGQGTYTLTDLPAATYHVVAYLVALPHDLLAGGYSQAVPCGLLASCVDHSLIDIQLKAGEALAGTNPTDWYAGDPASAGWPLDPTVVR